MISKMIEVIWSKIIILFSFRQSAATANYELWLWLKKLFGIDCQHL